MRWLSVEAMKDNLYSSKSDVWAFAIVLWEIGTLGNYRERTEKQLNIFYQIQKVISYVNKCSVLLNYRCKMRIDWVATDFTMTASEKILDQSQIRTNMVITSGKKMSRTLQVLKTCHG